MKDDMQATFIKDFNTVMANTSGKTVANTEVTTIEE